MHYGYLVIGGGIAGVTAAETIRSRDRERTIGILSSEPHLLYSRVLLPLFLKGRIKREQLFLRTVDDFEKNDIDLFLEKEIVSLDPSRREIRVKTGETYSFDKLLISSGGTPRPLGILGETKRGIFRLQSIDDADNIAERIPAVKKAAVIGGGFISLEFLEILSVHNISTTLLCRGERFFENALDEAGGELMARNFERHGINLVFKDEVEAFGGKDAVSAFRTKLGNVFEADFIGVGVGLKLNDDFLLGTGVSVSPGRGARTNEFLETPVHGIFAAGDVAEYFDTASGEYHTHGNWTNAFLQGKVAGENMVGRERVLFKNISSYSLTNLGFHITFLGEINEGVGVTTVSRADLFKNKYERFFLKEDRLVGAVLINMFQDKPILTGLIERKVLVGDVLDKLSDMAFDVKSLPR